MDRVSAQLATDPTELGGGSLDVLLIDEGAGLERLDSFWKVFSSVETIHSGKIQPK